MRWFKADGSAWEEVAATLPRPWPDAAVTLDLEYLAGRGRLPGRVVLQRRWGWGESRVRRVLASVQSEPGTETLTSHTAPTPTPRPPHAPPAPERVDADVQPETSRPDPTPTPRPPHGPPGPIYKRSDQIRSSSGEVALDPVARWAPVVVGAHPRAEYDEASPEVAELVAAQRQDGEPLFMARPAQVGAVIRSLRSGRSVEWHQAIVDIAQRREVRWFLWDRVLTDERYGWLRDAADRAVASSSDRPVHDDTGTVDELPLRMPE